tara:strand:- start:90 stop:557 length:468 start_codon:yes stop_codon:yes gene_type:complete
MNSEASKFKEINNLKKVSNSNIKTKEEIFKILSDKHLLDIYETISRAKRNGKTSQFMNHRREDFNFRTKIDGVNNSADLMRLWFVEIRNPDSNFLVLNKDGKKVCLDGINTNVWNNQKFTTEYSWDTSFSGCKHNGMPCNCLKLRKQLIDLSELK